MTPEEFRVYVNDDMKKYGDIIKKINLKLE